MRWGGADLVAMQNHWRQIDWMHDCVSPQGFAATGPLYFGFSMSGFMHPFLAYARHGENGFVTSHVYNVVEHIFYVLQHGDDGKLHTFAHMDGGGTYPSWLPS